MNYFFDPHAQNELRNATLHFDEIDADLGRDFVLEIERAISLVCNSQKVGLESHRQFDVAQLRDFRMRCFTVFDTTRLNSWQ